VITPPKVTGNTGAPVSSAAPSTKPPGHPLQWPAEYTKGMTPDQIRQEIEEYKRAQGASSIKDQARAMRERAEATRKKK
jgi:hypothetical protein